MRTALIDSRAGRVVVALAVGLAVVGLATMIPTDAPLALGIGTVFLMLGIILAAPALLLASVIACTYGVWRVGPGSLNMSICDAVTVLAVLAALPYVPWRSRSLRRVLLGVAIYLMLVGVTLVAHHQHDAVFEYFHRFALAGGTCLIGAAIARRGQTAISLKVFVLVGSFFAIAAIITSLQNGLQPAYPFGIHKNFVGPMFAMTFLLLVVAPWKVGLRPSVVRHLRVLFVVALLASQSRGAGLALVAVIAVYAMRHREAHRRAPLFFLTVSLVLIAVSTITLNDEYRTNPKFNAIDTRSTGFSEAVNDVWLPSPLVGGGLRWFRATDATNAGVHNLAIAELSENGLIGMLGFVILLGTIAMVLVHRRDPIGEAAFSIFLFEVLFAITEIFWVAGAVSFVMLMVGIAVGEEPGPAPSPTAPKALRALR